MFQMYEIIKIIFLYFVHEEDCQQDLSLFIYPVLLNLLWFLVTLYGISAINSRISRRVKKYKFLLYLVGGSRIALFIITMKIVEILSSSTENICSSGYQNGLYTVSALLEGSVIAVLLFLIKTIESYIKSKGNYWRYK